MTERLGDSDVESKYKAEMIATVHALDQLFNGDTKGQERSVGFILMVFPFNEHGGRCNYMSNGASRADVIVLLKEQLARFEGQAEVSGRA